MEAGISTYGEIVEIKGGVDGASHPVFEYQTEEGDRFRAWGVGSALPLYNIYYYHPVGSRVPVIYDPDNPGNAKIDTVMQAWAIPIFVSLFGLRVGIGFVRKGL